jgi:hypothetical protein
MSRARARELAKTFLELGDALGIATLRDLRDG